MPSEILPAPHTAPPCAIAIGNFDGVHAGHRQILRRVVALARKNGWRSLAMTFHPHPTRIVAPDRCPRIMTTTLQRVRMMESEGIDEVIVMPFTPEVALWSPDYFVREILVARLNARAILVGQDFRFGHKHAGNTRLLSEIGHQLGFTVELVSAVQYRGERVSSSRIRDLVESGRVSQACRCLTRPFTLEGNVIPGMGVGSKQTVPTLNLSPETEVIPATGVYVTRTYFATQSWPSITNAGYRPTFQDGRALTIETFLLSSLETTPARISVEFLLRLRDERKFDSPAALKSQIGHDVKRALTYFRRAPVPKPPPVSPYTDRSS